MSCASIVLATLPRNLLVTLKDTVTAARTALAVLRAQKEALVASINVQLLPMEALRALINNSIQEVRDGVSIVPQEAVLQCSELGYLNVAMQEAIAGPLQSVTNLLFDIERLLASRAAINLEMKQMDDNIKFFDDMLASIDTALITAV